MPHYIMFYPIYGEVHENGEFVKKNKQNFSKIC
jgi:hypothetical protein